jgi:hypothetical protein
LEWVGASMTRNTFGTISFVDVSFSVFASSFGVVDKTLKSCLVFCRFAGMVMILSWKIGAEMAVG